MYVEMVDPVGQILAEISDRRMTRDDVALSYAFCLRQLGTTSPEYERINRAIIDRWSMAALRYVKEKAWRLVSG